MSNNATEEPLMFMPPLAGGFIKSHAAFPQNNAIHINGIYYSYEELLAKAEIVFAQLKERKLPPFIGIYCNESVWTYAAIIAVSLSGACYVPLNANFPVKKLQSLIAVSDIKLIISETELFFVPAGNVLQIDKSARGIKCTELIHQSYAYLLFTSGTTGEPKGVPITKQNISVFFDYYKNNFDFNDVDRFLQPYELSFDVSVFSIFAAWNCGGCVYVVPGAGVKYLNIVSTIKQHGITVSSMVPAVLNFLEKYKDEINLPTIRYSFFSGDQFYHRQAGNWHRMAPNSRIFNCYGLTETTIVCTSYECAGKVVAPESVNGPVPIGKPFADMKYILVNEKGNEQNEEGELCLSGPLLFDSYLHGVNEEKFFAHNNERYFKTGDLVSINSNGNIVFNGRNDSQFKINGYRVEAGEIEEVIFKLTQVQNIVLNIETGNDSHLVAFVKKEIDENLNAQLSLFLPAYMIPAQYITVNEFPLTLHGKTDREQLKKIVNERSVVK